MSSVGLRSLVVLAATLAFLVNVAYASPALPPSLVSRPADPSYTLRIRHPRSLITHNRAKHGLGSEHSRSIDTRHTVPTQSAGEYRRLLARNTTNDPVATLQPSYNKIMNSSKQLSANAAVASSKVDDKDFQNQSPVAMNDFRGGLLEFQGLLSQLAADKGLANYDSGDKLETMLKNIINATKNLLSATDILVYRIPLLGPLLGPIVYQVKCIIDDLLDVTENITDGLLNELAPLLRGLDNQIVNLLCGPLLGIPILSAAGLCPQP